MFTQTILHLRNFVGKFQNIPVSTTAVSAKTAASSYGLYGRASGYLLATLALTAAIGAIAYGVFEFKKLFDPEHPLPDFLGTTAAPQKKTRVKRYVKLNTVKLAEAPKAIKRALLATRVGATGIVGSKKTNTSPKETSIFGAILPFSSDPDERITVPGDTVECGNPFLPTYYAPPPSATDQFIQLIDLIKEINEKTEKIITSESEEIISEQLKNLKHVKDQVEQTISSLGHLPAISETVIDQYATAYELFDSNYALLQGKLS